MSSSWLERMKTMPPRSDGPTLSAWYAPSALASPLMAKGRSCFLERGSPMSLFTAYTPATAEAADEPSPLPNGIFL